ncbi:MAG: histidine phosphatase family protein [Alphaproteobacteria bacterium]
MIRLAIALVGIPLFAGLPAAPGSATSHETTMIVLLRHAERDVLAENLNENGRNRAIALVSALSGKPLDAIYSPPLTRNLDTVVHLARDRGIKVTVIEPTGVADKLLDGNGGKTVMWVGNTTNLPGIYADLGGSGEPPVKYGDLFYLRLGPGGSVEVTRSRYGR